MADSDQSVLLRLKAEGRHVPQVDLRDAERDTVLSVAEVSLKVSGRFEVLGELAAGGVGQILKGRDIDLGRDVALKVIHEGHLSNEQVIQRFVEEAQIGGQLQHPGIVPVYELGLQADKRPFFAMKLVKGKTFAALLTERSSPAEDRRRILQIFEEICQTVGYAHARGVVHRDLKPANVMVGAFGEVQVLDWGFAKVLARGGVADEKAARSQAPVTEIATVRTLGEGSDSIAGSVMGTLAYMPPEQALGQVESLDERSDVFSLGAILCEVLTGKAPYVGEGRDLLIQAAQCRLDGAFARLEKSGAPERLIELTKQCLSPLGGDRPRSAAALAEVIRDYLAQAEERARASALAAAESRAEAERADQEATDQRRVRRLGLALSGSVVAVLLLAGAGVFGWQSSERSRQERARSAVTAALNEAEHLRGQEAWTEALQLAAQAEELARSPEVDEATRQRAAALLADVTAEETAARAEAEQAMKDATLLAELEELRLARFDDDVDIVAIDAAHADAFREYGIETETTVPAAASERIRARGEAFAVEIAAALDEWSAMRRAWPALADTDAEPPSRLAAVCDPDPQQQRLRALIETGDQAGLVALANDETALGLPTRSLVALARALRQHDQPEARITLLECALRRHPDDLWLNAMLQTSYREADRFEDALRHATVVVALRPESARAHHLLGRLHFNLRKEYEPAEAAFRKAIELDATQADYHCHLANALLYQGRIDEAIAAYREAIRLAPEYGDAYGGLGDALAKKEQTDEAIAAYQEEIRLDPDSAIAYVNLGTVLGRVGRIDEAIDALRCAIRSDPELAVAHVNLGNALNRKGRFDEAVAAHHVAIRLEPDHPWNHRNLAFTLEAAGRFDEAIEARQAAIRLDPDFAQTHLNLGVLLLQHRHDFEGAETAFRTAIELAPGMWKAHGNLGVVLHGTGRIQDALASVRRAHELAKARRHPDQQDYERRIELLERRVAAERSVPALLAGELEPEDGLELVAASDVCRLRQRNAAAAELSSRAFEMDPALAQDFSHRYNAACAAALCGTGRGQDADSLDKDARAKWRAQALAWLRADLAWKRERMPANQLAPTLQHWLRDPDLAGVRDEAELAKLPEEERAAWAALWRSVLQVLEQGEDGG